MGFGGGGYSAPPVPEYTVPEKPQVAKPVTEAATAARQSQKEKAAKASGIQGAVLTSALQSSTSGTQGNGVGSTKYLGQ